MKLTNKALEELIKEIGNENTLSLVKLIKNKKNISEFVIAEKLKLTVNQVRNTLYKLQNYNLVSFTRKKDKKKGWYIYYWTFDLKRAKEVAINIKKERLEALKNRLEREQTSNFFICPDECMRMDFETAMEYEYKCQECGRILVKEDNTKKIEKIKEEIKTIEQELAEKEIPRKRRAKSRKKPKRKPKKKAKKTKRKTTKKKAKPKKRKTKPKRKTTKRKKSRRRTK